MSAQNNNSRASLLAGLRTGGVRSASHTIPHTAAPGASFHINRAPSYSNQQYYPEEEDDQFFEIHNRQQIFAHRGLPMTAAVDGPNNRFMQQQQQARIVNPHSAAFPNNYPQANNQYQGQNNNNALQMQMMQLEVMRIQQQIQAQQAAQFQAQLLAQQQQQQQQQIQMQQARRASVGFNPPATAGPLTQSFPDLRSPPASAARRVSQVEHLRASLGVSGGPSADDQAPMTAALGGRFGSRMTSVNVMSNEDHPQPLPTAVSTNVISGGTSLGAPAPSKSDAASSWRSSGNNSVLRGNRTTSLSVKVTPPPGEVSPALPQRVSPPPGLPAPVNNNSATAAKFRPQPLRFSPAVQHHVPAVTIDTTDDDTDEFDTHSQSSGSSVKSSSPTTPRSASSNELQMPLSPREEASKKLYEGLGIGRPVSATPSDQAYPATVNVHLVKQAQYSSALPTQRLVSQPTRQPRGPPSGTDELGPKNFASRIRRKAIGGLGVLMDARERREPTPVTVY